jgi:hypothetical protein
MSITSVALNSSSARYVCSFFGDLDCLPRASYHGQFSLPFDAAAHIVF